MIENLHTAIIMPFKNDEIDYKSLDKILDFQHKNGVDGIVLHGTTGEAPTISDEEFVKSSNYVLDNWKKKFHITIGISANATSDVLKKQNMLNNLPDAFLVTPPAYSKPTQTGIFKHFEEIAKNTSVPIILYNVPGRTISDLLPQTIVKLLENYKNIVAIKDATGSFARFADEQYTLKNFQNFSFLTGDDGTTPHFLLSGGNGVISVVSNIMPKEFANIVKLAKNGNVTDALSIHFKLYNLIRLLFVESNPIPVKYIMYKMGFCELNYRLPMCEPSANLMEEIDMELKKLNLI